MRKLKIPYEFLRPTEVDHRERDLVLKLRDAGLDIVSTFELKQTSEPYPEAVPVLIEFLVENTNHDRDVLDHVVRSLTVKEARGIAFEPIYEMYIKDKDTSDYGAKAGMANALSYLAEKKDMPRIIELALNSQHGSTRGYFIDKIAASSTKENTPYIKEVLQKLVKDKDLGVSLRSAKALKRKKFQ
jgi:hypothetical protein